MHVICILFKISYSCKKRVRPSKADCYAYLRQKVVTPYAAKCDCKVYAYSDIEGVKSSHIPTLTEKWSLPDPSLCIFISIA